MSTKKYVRFFNDLVAAGEIPQELYDKLIAEIEADGKMTRRVYELYLLELEKRRLFGVDGTPNDKRNSAKTDGTYRYLRTRNPWWYIYHAFASTVYKLAGLIGAPLVYGVWRIKDRKKIKKLGACISLSNHVGYIDCALTRKAFGCKKQYVVVAPHNSKNNFGGRFMAAAAAVPLPVSFKGVKPFNEALGYYAKRGACIHFYAEQTMWVRYTKPRPYMAGAFHYADSLDLPVVVMLYCFKEPKGLRKLLGLAKADVKIAEPIYPDKALPRAERRADLAEKADAAVKKLYEEFYGKPLEYENEEQPADAMSADED